MNDARLWFLLGLSLLIASACRQASPPSGGPDDRFTPGLGELMSLQQTRHAKLWFAGEAGNWALADYELDELGEGFDDIVKYHPTHKDSPVAPKDAIPRMVTQPIADLRTAITHHDTAGFAQAYDTLTAACNNCHQATNFSFNRVQRPTANPYSNQVFTAPAR